MTRGDTPPLRASLARGSFARDPWHPGVSPSAFRKSTAKRGDSGTKPEVSHGRSPFSGGCCEMMDHFREKTPGHRNVRHEGSLATTHSPWDTSVFVPKSSFWSVLFREARRKRRRQSRGTSGHEAPSQDAHGRKGAAGDPAAPDGHLTSKRPGRRRA